LIFIKLLHLLQKPQFSIRSRSIDRGKGSCKNPKPSKTAVKPATTQTEKEKREERREKREERREKREERREKKRGSPGKFKFRSNQTDVKNSE